jgi:hypothetical protein
LTRPPRLALAVVLAAAAVLASACAGLPGSTAAPAAAPTAFSPAHAATPTPPPAPSCRQQYEAWKHGPATAQAAKVKAALTAVRAQSQAGDVPRMTVALQRLARAARIMAADPPPRCADPAAYYQEMLAKLQAAGDNAGSAPGVGGLLLAAAVLKQVPPVERALSRELDRTVGPHR